MSRNGRERLPVPPDVVRRADEIAKREQRSRDGVLLAALRRGLDSYELAGSEGPEDGRA